MRELDIQYPIHREAFINRLKKQTMIAELGLDEDTSKRRGRKPTKQSKYVETEKNIKMYAPKRY